MQRHLTAQSTLVPQPPNTHIGSTSTSCCLMARFLRFYCPIPAWLWLCGVALMVAGWHAVWAEPRLDVTSTLAQERYGAPAATLVKDWRRLLESARTQAETEQLTSVNTFFNRRLIFESDEMVWQQKDHWATPLEFMGRGMGDCEDFTIAKYMSLLLLGVPHDKLRLIYVRARTGGAGSGISEAHMVLGYYAQPDAEPLILDNLISNIRPASMRSDLSPIFSFSHQGLWVAGASTSSADPTARLSRWRQVLEQARQEGVW